MEPRRCRRCNALISFVQMPNGRWQPVDETDKRTYVVTDGGLVVSGRTPHWATCTDPGEFRERERPQQRQGTLFDTGETG